ncbi:MAG: response regulator [Candidatus Omnitrophota bacterium]
MKDKTVLIVDDNKNNLKLAGEIIRSLGMKTIEATDAKSAIALARKHLPDLILMDIQLPGMDGVEATGILKNDDRTKHIPIVALTSHAMNGDKKKILAAGCDAYLAKPFGFDEFVNTVKGLLGEKTDG